MKNDLEKINAFLKWKHFNSYFFIFAGSVCWTRWNISWSKLENVARIIGKELRCLVCQNEDIENSNADIAKDLRILVRKMLSEGKTKDEIISYVHSRYGDFVLFNPPVRFDTSLLWLLPIIFLIFLCYTFFRKKH